MYVHSVTAITKPQVRKSDIAQFEAWMKKIGHSAKAFPGHAGVTVLSPEQSLIDSSFDHDIFEFICILKFHDFTSLKTWL
jgi:antibiotic biosynthesis monooxygenase (ABM) superfamily enzyme